MLFQPSKCLILTHGGLQAVCHFVLSVINQDWFQAEHDYTWQDGIHLAKCFYWHSIHIHQKPRSVRQSLYIYCYVSTSSLASCICSYLLCVMYSTFRQEAMGSHILSLPASLVWLNDWNFKQNEIPHWTREWETLSQESKGSIHHSVSVYLPGDKVIRPWKLKNSPSHLPYHSCIRHYYDFLYYGWKHWTISNHLSISNLQRCTWAIKREVVLLWSKAFLCLPGLLIPLLLLDSLKKK